VDLLFFVDVTKEIDKATDKGYRGQAERQPSLTMTAIRGS
jgi:hypothetical protein